MADESTEPTDDQLSETNQSITVSGLGHYCSGTWASGGWAFTSNSNGGDPCAAITSTGGTVRHKGLYANNAMNRVVYRCYPPYYGYVGVYEGLGNGPLTSAYNAAQGLPGCVFIASPVSLPIFDSPFPLATSYTHATGVDFARRGGSGSAVAYDVAEFGQPGSTMATIVDHKGRDRSTGGYIDNHDGHDFPMPRDTAIKATADGTVVMARSWLSPCTTSDSQYQTEVAIRHTVYGSGTYYERFVTYYAHLTSIDPAITVGASVTKGQEIGRSGNTGCSSAPHLHFGVIRLTNTSDQLEESITWYPGSQHSDATDKAIEPYGWSAPQGFDPFSYRVYPYGALSINLWNANQAPSVGGW